MNVDASAGSFGSGRAGPLARAAVLLGAVAVTFAIARPLTVAAGGDATWMGSAGFAAGLLALAAGFGDLLHAATTARTPWQRTGGVIALAGLATVVIFFYGAYRDGDIRLDRFTDQFLNGAVFRAVFPDLLRGVINTVRAAFFSEVLAIAAGLVLASMRLSPRRWLRWPAAAYIDVVRATPLVVLTLLINGGLPKLGLRFGDFAYLLLILAVNASAYIAEIFRAGIESLPRGQREAALSLGMPSATAQFYVVLPQAGRAVIPPLLSEFIALIKDTAIVLALIGFTVATRDVFGAAKSGVAATFKVTPYVGAAAVYVAMVIPLSRAVGVLESRLRVSRA